MLHIEQYLILIFFETVARNLVQREKMNILCYYQSSYEEITAHFVQVHNLHELKMIYYMTTCA